MAIAGYSGKSLTQKLGVKSGDVVRPIDAPEHYAALLDPLPEGARLEEGGRDVAIVHAFVRSVGEAFLDVYPTLVERRFRMPYTEADREKLFLKRGRYVEFNLVYDRGTKFGFATDADPEAYLMSLPPIVKW